MMAVHHESINFRGGEGVKFKNIEEIQSVLDKTTSTEQRLEASLLLLSGEFAELKKLIKPLEEYKKIIQKKPNPEAEGA